VAGLAFSAGTAQTALAQSKTEIQQMDRNGDGVVTRAEWQGPDGAFRLHDTNKDGVLSGSEVFDAAGGGRNQPFTDWTPRGFAELDRNSVSVEDQLQLGHHRQRRRFQFHDRDEYRGRAGRR